ncbi:helix-turn-helix transcriptional regulator [Pseudonocardia sulfidoxydans NBRC 16205]|uniref:Helix-turn-helix transcriptional regulator n=1 Tax=Pseudonocardia sulfidoxydans NBRC 16205 TaxID=1223511 RepID=A0A511DJ08_9PSEU|nr:LuxR C-terminal-related transcriptional regulator [Pseudonocardia sulfidoxydans]GEL24792.1 helix-turn-helix transcriptional regulator [Pseudonocardia sulfidoxydans NBRC 16205]
MTTVSDAERVVLRACRVGPDVGELQRSVLAALRRVVTVDAAFVTAADPETLLFTGVHVEEPLAAVTAQFLANEFGGGGVNTFAGLVGSAGHVCSLDEATGGDRMASPRYREILRPIGLGDELRAALVSAGQCWGYLCLHRADGGLGFGPGEIEVVQRVVPHLAHALRQAVVLHAPAPEVVGRPGVVLLDERHELVACTAEAEELLALLPDRSSRLPLPVSVYAVAAAVDVPGRSAGVRVRAGDGGWLYLHASRTAAAAAPIAVVVERAEPRSTLGLLLAAHDLTSRELDVARLVLRGESTRSIAAALHISAYTVQDHLKSVFDKVGVRSRRDLVGRLLAGPPG